MGTDSLHTYDFIVYEFTTIGLFLFKTIVANSFYYVATLNVKELIKDEQCFDGKCSVYKTVY